MYHHFPTSKENREQQLQRQVSTKLINDVIDGCIPYIEKTAYLEVLEKSPHLINQETDPLRFLKFEQWNIWAAAQRMVKYWEWKRTIFGDDRTFRSITDLTGAGALNQHEVDVFGTGFMTFLPKDEYGNVYGFMNGSRCNPPIDSLETITKLRLFFYHFCVFADLYYENQDFFAGSENDGNETGIILFNIIVVKVPSPTGNVRDIMNQAMPIRLIRLHNIFYPTNTSMLSLENYVIPSFMSISAPILSGFTNLCFHYCSSPNEAIHKLRQHRIPQECIPAILGGNWSYDEFEDWFIQASLQIEPIALDLSQVQQQIGIQSTVINQQQIGIQSTVINDSYLFQSEPFTYQDSNSSFLGKTELPIMNLVEDMSQNSKYDMSQNSNYSYDDDAYITSNESASTASVPFVNCSGAVAIKTVTAAPSTDSSVQVQQQQYDSSCERCNDSVESEYDTTSNPNGVYSNISQDRWSETFTELCKYRDKMGHCLVPQTYTENDVAIGAWVKRQRYQHKLMLDGKPSHMTEDRLKSLNDIGFVWDSQEVAWHIQLNELKLFKGEFQHCNVPVKFPQNPKLAAWVQRQRKQYKLYCQNKPSTLTPERFHELEKIDFE